MTTDYTVMVRHVETDEEILLGLGTYDDGTPSVFWHLPDGGADGRLVSVAGPDFDTQEEALEALAEAVGDGDLEMVLGAEPATI